MIKRTVRYIWAAKRELAKYIAVGLSGVLLDIGTLKFLTFHGLRPTLAIIINQALLLTYNFLLNKYWSFANREMPHKQVVRYIILATWNYFFSVVMMYVGNEYFGFDPVLVRVASIAVMTMWNFVLYKHWVYRSAEPVYNLI
jgi:putative flippase GtrA